jgi:hypothetical protein
LCEALDEEKKKEKVDINIRNQMRKDLYYKDTRNYAEYVKNLMNNNINSSTTTDDSDGSNDDHKITDKNKLPTNESSQSDFDYFPKVEQKKKKPSMRFKKKNLKTLK